MSDLPRKSYKADEAHHYSITGVENLLAENMGYRRALVAIMREDYRGPMPESVRIAADALAEFSKRPA